MLRRIMLYIIASPAIVYVLWSRATRRIEWWWLRRRMISRIRLFVILVKTVQRRFKRHPDIVRVSHVIAPRRGYTFTESSEVWRTLYWEAPLGITIWTKDGPAAGMAVEFRGNTLCIRQLQGVAGVRLAGKLQAWPQFFVLACMQFVRRTGLKGVRVYHANQSLFYEHPAFGESESGTYGEARRRVQSRMRLRYEGTANTLGFISRKRWSEWINPKWYRSR